MPGDLGEFEVLDFHKPIISLLKKGDIIINWNKAVKIKKGVVRMYKEDGFNTNQAYMSVGNEQSIYLSDPPCLRGIDTRVIDETLHFIVYFRSWDLWAGFPSNLAAIQLLKEYMSSEIGVKDGELIASSKGLHLYEYTWDLARVVARMD